MLNPTAVVTVLICRAVIGVTGAHWLTLGDGLSASVAFVALALTFPATQFLRDQQLRTSTAVVIALLLAAHVALGMHAGFYETSALYDKAMHLIGSGAIAVILIVAVQTYCNQTSVRLPSALFLAFVFAATLSAGTLWELFEFSIDRTGWFVAQRGLKDTMLDLLANTLGAVLALTIYEGASEWIAPLHRKPTTAPLGRSHLPSNTTFRNHQRN